MTDMSLPGTMGPQNRTRIRKRQSERVLWFCVKLLYQDNSRVLLTDVSAVANLGTIIQRYRVIVCCALTLDVRCATQTPTLPWIYRDQHGLDCRSKIGYGMFPGTRW